MSDPYVLLRKFVTPGDLPAEFSAEFYRFLHDDLRTMSDEALRDHYANFGRAEGRLASPAAHRQGLLASIPAGASVLEIGPFNRPALVGPNVKYFDVLDRAALIDRAESFGLPTGGIPVCIDFISPTGDMSIVQTAFDGVFSSHCIEHQPDLIDHLKHVGRVLKNEGLYYLAIPDKRFCFDHFIEETETSEIVKAHEERRKVHTFKSVYEHTVMTTHNDPEQHWRGNSADPRLTDRPARADYAIRRMEEAKGGYIDVHAWQFTPHNFRRCMTEIYERGLSPLRVERVYDTGYGLNEFMAVLIRDARRDTGGTE